MKCIQSSPNDTHDWTRRRRWLFDAEFNGQPRKLLAQASRNGKFFVLDRRDGTALVSSDYVVTNWSLGFDKKGEPIPNPAKNPQIDGALVTPNQGGATNWPPPSFSPDTGLLYERRAGLQRLHIYDPGDNPQGWGGTDRGLVRAWWRRRPRPARSADRREGMSGLSTAGNPFPPGTGRAGISSRLTRPRARRRHAGVRSPVSTAPSPTRWTAVRCRGAATRCKVPDERIGSFRLKKPKE
jgi:hypothetical protein